MGRSQTTVCKTSQQPDQPWDVRFQMILVLFRLILIALHQLYVMLSEAKHLYRRRRDPSLPLRMTICKVICVTKNSKPFMDLRAKIRTSSLANYVALCKLS